MRWRIVMRRVMLVGDEARTLEDALRLLKVMGIASVRLRKAIKLKADLKHKQTELRWEAFFRRPGKVEER
jgi:phosphoribosylformylglycinamidine (FGAM) synthase PurS component